MSMTTTAALAAILAATLWIQDDWLTLDAKTSRSTALSTRVNGQVGSSFDFRITGTDRSYNFKLRATWLTPEVIRATARLRQLADGLTDEEARKLVEEAEAAGDTVMIVEIDPREGSGIIPRDWTARLMPRGAKTGDGKEVKGVNAPHLREVPVLRSVAQRDYAYDLFWVVFPLRRADGQALFSDTDKEAELAVNIYNKEGRVRWQIPESIRRKLRDLPAH